MFAGVALIACAFVLGSVPTGILLARARSIDLRAIGSGNIGATNVGRALGRRWAVVVLLVDAGKGFLPVFVGQRIGAGAWAVAAAGLASVLGHSFSIFLRGRGGKGVATSLGAALGLAPLPALGCCVVYAALFAAFRISSIGSLLGVAAFPLFVWLLGAGSAPVYAFAASTAVLVTARHKDNLRRLAEGKELRG